LTPGATFRQPLTASGGNVPGYVFTLRAGQLPPGVSLSPAGVLSGRAPSGAYSFTVQAANVDGFAGQQAYVLTAQWASTVLLPMLMR
jgi:hypothetical protein